MHARACSHPHTRSHTQQCEALYKELIADGETSAADLESSDMKSGLEELQQLYADKAKALEARTEELQSGAQVRHGLGPIFDKESYNICHLFIVTTLSTSFHHNF